MAWESVLLVTYDAQNYTFDGNVYEYKVTNDTATNATFIIGGTRITLNRNTESMLPLAIGVYRVSIDAVGIGFTLHRQTKNQAPTQPGTFTQPTGELEIGDIRTISWGASTDAEGNVNLAYELDYAVNGGSWANLINLGSTNFSWSIPISTSVKFRVRASDGQLLSPYRESPTYTVTKPKYYWSKYNVVTQYLMNMTTQANVVSPYLPGSLTYNFDSKTGNYTIGSIQENSWSSGRPVYDSGGNIANEYTPIGTTNTWRHVLYGSNLSDSRGTLIQSGLIAEEGTYPTDGKHTDGYWYIRGSRVNQSIPPAGAFSAPAPTAILKPGQGVAVTFAASTAPNISLYELEYRYNSGLWTTLGTNNTALSRSFTPTTDKSLTNVQFRVRAKNTSNAYSDYVYSETFNIEHNAKPTLTLTTANNLILAETNTIVVAGQALDTDTGNVVNVYYQINTGNNVAIATGISNGTAPLPFSKTLTFKEGKLFDGTTVIASNLVETQTYTLKVWSEDNQGGKSDVQTRSFKVIPNRAPLLTVAAITQKTGLINNDTIAITGTVTDPENQTVKVKYKINGGALIQGYSGAGGNFSFNIKTGDLLTGDNTIELQASDTYDLITTKKYKFNKVKNTTNLLTSVVRYKVTVPVVGTTGIVTWIERDNGDLTVTPALSMRMTGETESYTAMEQQVTAPVNGSVTEDQYRLTPASAKTDVTFKLTLTKTAAASDKGVKKITGALQ